MKFVRSVLLTAACAVLVACASPPGGAPITANEQEVAAVVAVTTARTTALQLLQAGKITPAQAQTVNSSGDAIVTIINNIRTSPSPTPNLDPRLGSALKLLATLQLLLETYGGGQQ